MRSQRTRTEAVDVERVDLDSDRRVESRSGVAVGSVHDPAEAHADRLADRALSLSAEYAGGSTRAPHTDTDTDTVRRSAVDSVDGLRVEPSALRAAASAGGRPLDPEQRASLEHGFGTDLGDVRVHTGSPAADIARDIHARAFTQGNDVFFGAGEFRPGTAAGDRVLAHEVAHTLQSSDAVHRFPATWRTSPVPWKPMTSSVFRPGEGASGGVYILTSNDGVGPVKKAVVKPVFGRNGLNMRETGQQLQFSDVALGKLLGLNAPESKVVNRGGSEFNDLVELCRSKQPPPNPGETAPSLADAESFVVMSEVPNASSIASLADKAPTDKRAAADLHRAVFDPVFLAELGKLCIGDLMLGNPDRIVLGAMNLGNVMVSMVDGRAKIAAIDTTAYLPRAVSPGDWARSGGSGGGGFANTKSALEGGPGEVLDGFFEVLVNRLKRGTPDDAGPMPTWQVIEATYKANRDHVLASFDFGWNDALITALQLSSDRERVESTISGYSDQDLTSDTLMANLDYLGSRAQGKSHDDSIGRSMALTARGWIQSAVDHSRLSPPMSDSLGPKTPTVPTGKAVRADVVDLPRLPTGKNLDYVVRKGGGILPDSAYTSIPNFIPRIDESHRHVDAAVSETKSRRKKPFGRKEDVPRNRNVLGHYIVDATALGAGGSRLSDAAAYSLQVARDAEALVGADFRGNEATPLKNLFNQLGSSVPVLARHIATYRRHLAAAPAVVEASGHSDKTQLAQVLRNADTSLEDAIKRLSELKKMDLRTTAASLTASRA